MGRTNSVRQVITVHLVNGKSKRIDNVQSSEVQDGVMRILTPEPRMYVFPLTSVLYTEASASNRAGV